MSELAIPAPAISRGKDPAELKVARTLQPFACVTAGTSNLAGAEFRNPIYALGYLPGRGGRRSGKLYFCGWRAYTSTREYSRGACGADLAKAKPAGMWTLAGHSAFTAASAVMEVPAPWAEEHCPGMRLAWAGGINGTHGYGTGKGPAVVATAPWAEGEPPPPGTAIRGVTLLKYGQKADSAIRDCQYADGWHGAARVTRGKDSAVLFLGLKDLGESWYGYPKDEKGQKVFDRKQRKEGESRFVNARGEPVEKVSGHRGWKADVPRACIYFYDPGDLAAVASGRKKPHEPQPYARLDVSRHMFAGTSGLRGCGYDRRGGLLYSFELSAGPKARGHGKRVPIVHVWRVLPAGK